jgi:hypothetical protein
MLQQQKYNNNKRYIKTLIFGLKALDKKTQKKCVLTGEKIGHLSR